MASYTKRGKTWRVQIQRGTLRQSATFPTKSEAQAWAVEQEAELRNTKHGAIPKKTLADLLDRYELEVSHTKRGHDWERKRISVIKGYKIASVRLSDLDATHVSTWRDERGRDVSSASVLRDWNLLSHACEVARREWKWLLVNPFKEVKRPKDSPPRQRVFTEGEIERICFALGIDVHGIAPLREFTISQRVALAFLFALETGMRAGEIVWIRREDIHASHVHLPMTKNGSARDVPLTTRAREIVNLVPDGFGIESRQLDALFRKAKKRAGCEDAHFHDSRRTALTKLAKILSPMELARVSGHRDLNLLLGTYYAPDIGELAGKMG